MADPPATGAPPPLADEPRWWQTGVLYQIYPRSFADSDGDGIGDLAGITGRLDYLVDLGVDALWLSPIYPSPMADFGYDISDYTGVDPVFGTLADLDHLVSEAHRRGLKVVLDLVPNHTSDEHPWFVASRASRSNPYRDWYLWRDPGPGGRVPNNWESIFGGPAWEWDGTTGQFYLHLFHRKQPDLNWRNPDVRAAIHDTMRLWFARGVDGFRIDVLWMLIKDEGFGDNPLRPPLREGEHPWGRYDLPAFEDRPEMLEIVKELRTVADEFDERVLIGEIYLPIDRLMRYYGEGAPGIHLPFNFGLVTRLDWSAAAIRRTVDAYEAALPPGAWPNWVLGNHDVPRIATRLGQDLARVAQMLLLTLRGTPTCYYGDELGMPDTPIPPDRWIDPQAANGMGRDPERTPMQWDDGETAGFAPSGTRPWLPLGRDATERNVAVQLPDPESMLSLVRSLTRLRREHPSLARGSYRSISVGDEDVFAYVREHGDERLLVALNFGDRGAQVDVSELGSKGAVLLSATTKGRDEPTELAGLQLDPSEGLIVALPNG
jgi:alpha-glucosidase